uniref:(northern house mosquito) hypothetical protein n=1 Tax=Culex pipiens TaxID=7175 RepID=A0A8D8C7S6_CULPI
MRRTRTTTTATRTWAWWTIRATFRRRCAMKRVVGVRTVDCWICTPRCHFSGRTTCWTGHSGSTTLSGRARVRLTRPNWPSIGTSEVSARWWGVPVVVSCRCGG